MKTVTLTIQQLERIIKHAKLEQKTNSHYSDSVEITQDKNCTIVLLLTSNTITNSNVIINEFYK